MRRTDAEKAVTRSKAHPRIAPPKNSAQNSKPGWPKGRKNREKTPVVLSPELQQIHAMMPQQLTRMNGVIPVCHVVLDGHFGTHPALHMVRRVG
jgi:putative transposase